MRRARRATIRYNGGRGLAMPRSLLRFAAAIVPRGPLVRAATVGLALAAAVALPACQKRASDNGDARRMPKPPPPPHVEVPATVRITVEVDGEAAPPIDAERLASLPPDFQDEERRAWRLARVLGAPAERPGATIAVRGEKGPAVLMGPAAAPGEPEPVLALSRRGMLIATTLAPNAPFPDFHGRGGQLGRGGDPLPRIEGVTHIRVSTASQAAGPR